MSKDAAGRLADELPAKPMQKEGQPSEHPFPEKDGRNPVRPRLLSKKQSKSECTSNSEDWCSVREELNEDQGRKEEGGGASGEKRQGKSYW